MINVHSLRISVRSESYAGHSKTIQVSAGEDAIFLDNESSLNVCSDHHRSSSKPGVLFVRDILAGSDFNVFIRKICDEIHGVRGYCTGAHLFFF